MVSQQEPLTSVYQLGEDQPGKYTDAQPPAMQVFSRHTWLLSITMTDTYQVPGAVSISGRHERYQGCDLDNQYSRDPLLVGTKTNPYWTQFTTSAR